MTADEVIAIAQQAGYPHVGLRWNDRELSFLERFGALVVEADRAMRAPQPSPASQGDALDAARYRWLCGKFGETRLPCALEQMLEHGYIADGKPSIDAAIDTASAAQEGK